MKWRIAGRPEPLWLWGFMISGGVALTLCLVFLVMYGTYSDADCHGLGCLQGTEWLGAAAFAGLIAIVLWIITGVAWFLVVDSPRRAERAKAKHNTTAPLP